MRICRPSPALAVATVALVVASTGSAVGASLITGRQVKNGSLTGRDIKNHSLTRSDVRGVGARGPAGPAGPAGAPGPAGPPGPTALAKLTRIQQNGSVAPGDVNGVSASCPPGMNIVSGGAMTAGAGVIFAEDSFGGQGWSVLYDNSGSSVAADVRAVAYCATAGQAVTARVHRGMPAAARRALARQRRLRAR